MSVIIEGTLAEVQKRLSQLPLPPNASLRVVVDETEEHNPAIAAFLATAERKNGLIMVPLRYKGEPVTSEIVKMLSEEE